jgi:hypothetical protein
MKFRLKMVPIETMETGKIYLNALNCAGKTDKELSVVQGPCVLEISTSTYGKDDDWKPVEFSE